jgi:DNA repair exonuclease SbcCD ATPase subunit
MQKRLYSITEKVKLLESDHHIEMTLLRENLHKAEGSLNILNNLKLKATDINHELDRRIDELALTNGTLVLQLSKQKEEMITTETNFQNRIEKLVSDNSSGKKNYDEIQESKNSLRVDLEEAETKLILFKNKIKESDDFLFKITEEKNSYQLALEKLTSASSSINNTESKELKKSLLLAQQTATDRETG